MKITAIIAGLLGVAVSMMRKSRYSLRTRIIGFVTGSLTVLFAVPVILHAFGIYWHDPLHPAWENFIAFSVGLVAKDITESFIDDPQTTINEWAEFIRRVTFIFAPTEIPSIKPEAEENKEQKNGKK
jgi:hypothetical protein